MSWRNAPLYVRCHDLARWVLPRMAACPHPQLRDRVTAEALELLTHVSIALTFTEDRHAQLRDADHAIVALRVQLRLALDLGFLPSNSHRYATDALSEIGRMLGGWRRHEARRGPREEVLDPSFPTGGEPQAAPGA